MKIVDEKGKLFGIINIIDLCVLLAIVLVVVFVGYKYIGKKSPSGTSSVKTITVELKCAARNETSATAIKKGDKIVSLTSFSGAVVTKVRRETAIINVTTADGKLINVEDPRRKDVYVTISMTADLSQPVIKLGSQEIAIGKNVILKTPRTEYANAVVQDIKE